MSYVLTFHKLCPRCGANFKTHDRAMELWGRDECPGCDPRRSGELRNAADQPICPRCERPACICDGPCSGCGESPDVYGRCACPCEGCGYAARSCQCPEEDRDDD